MRAYVITTAAVFALLVVAHVVRVALEGTRLLTEPDFVLATLIPAALCVWAWRLLRGGKAPAEPVRPQ
jgi:hypothetical protein